MILSSHSIGIFDSGVGGLTVMQQLMHILPHERLIYFGDTARIPYGNKSSQTIIRYSIENTIFLLEKNIKLLVVACNTASAFALNKLRELFKNSNYWCYRSRRRKSRCRDTQSTHCNPWNKRNYPIRSLSNCYP